LSCGGFSSFPFAGGFAGALPLAAAGFFFISSSSLAASSSFFFSNSARASASRAAYFCSVSCFNNS
jgi:hypothetical protein